MTVDNIYQKICEPGFVSASLNFAKCYNFMKILNFISYQESFKHFIKQIEPEGIQHELF